MEMLDVRARGGGSVLGLGRRSLVTAVAVAAWVALAGAAQASAATFKVCPSGCTYSTIQDAIDHAHNGDTINIAAATGPYAGFSLPGGNANGLTSIALTGAGPGETTIVGRFSNPQVVEIGPGVSVNLSGVTITGGCACSDDSSSGGGILINGGTLRLSNSTVSGNAARDGGGIYNDGGTLSLNNSTVSNNYTDNEGGGIFNGGTLTLNNSTVTGNSENGGAFAGGGIFNGGTLTLTNSTVSGNVAFLGGGIFNGGTGTLQNSTVTGNKAVALHPEGGGIFNHGTLTLNNSTVTGNTAGDGSLPTDQGGGIFNEGAGTILSNSTVQCNIPDDFFPPGSYLVIGKNNTVGGGSC